MNFLGYSHAERKYFLVNTIVTGNSITRGIAVQREKKGACKWRSVHVFAVYGLTVMEAKEYEVLYNILAYHIYPEGITMNYKNALSYNIAKKFVVREGPCGGDGNHYIASVNEGIQIHHVGKHWVTSSI